MNRRWCWAWWCLLMLVGCSDSAPDPTPGVPTDAGADGSLAADTGSSCAGRVCGSSSAGDFCGSCAAPSVCNAAGQCEARVCQSACGTNDCGSDPGLNCEQRFCGTNGGACPSGLTCVRGRCLCTPSCNGRTCGADGCGGVCGVCGRGFRCGDSGGCEVDPASRWVITAISGTVATAGAAGAWDPFGGAPDPQVCITLNGQRACTPYASDTFSPTWNFAFSAATAEALQAGIMTSYLDYDTGSADDTICDLRIRVGPMAFEAGGLTVPCTYGTWAFTLRAQ